MIGDELSYVCMVVLPYNFSQQHPNLYVSYYVLLPTSGLPDRLYDHILCVILLIHVLYLVCKLSKVTLIHDNDHLFLVNCTITISIR